MPFAARYPGTCQICKHPVNVGDPIEMRNRPVARTLFHANCLAESKAAKEAGTLQSVPSVPVYSAPIIPMVSAPLAHHETVNNPNDPLGRIIADYIKAYLPEPELKLDADAIRELVKQEIASAPVSTSLTHHVVTLPDGRTNNVGIQHKMFGKLLTVVSQRLNAWLAGPAGSGKTTAAESVAKALGLEFYFCGAQSNEYGLLGFKSATGELVRTAFREAYENGGVFLFDEIDGSHPSALLAFNAALANGHCAFPDGRIAKHADFVAIAAANTYGLGGTNDYVGRMKQDASVLDRFVFLAWDIDEELERTLAANDIWVSRVQTIRSRVRAKQIKVLITPRASIYGAKLLAAGMPQSEVEEIVLRKGMDDTQWLSIAS